MRHRDRGARPGFTLLELLVAISIITVLLLLSGGAALRFMVSATASATRTTIDRVGIRLNAQMAAVRDKAARDAIPGSIMAMAGGDEDRARVIYIKMKLKQAFPVSFYEVFYPARDPANGADHLRPLDAYQRQLEKAGITRTNLSATPQAHESAACLYLALRYGPDGTSDDDLGMGGSLKSVGGVPVLADAWGTPLVFCRWPAGDASGASLVNPGGYAAAAGFNDAGDPRGTLSNAGWLGINDQGGAFTRICHPVQAGKSLNLAPTLMSCGADKNAGAVLGTLASTGTASNDNIIGDRIK